jgi:hypothetical protein
MSDKLPAVVTAGSSSRGNSLSFDKPRNDDHDPMQSQEQLKPRAFKFGQVDQNLLMSRLYSTPLKKESSSQKYMLDMCGTSFQKPVLRKLDAPPPKPEPIVI